MTDNRKPSSIRGHAANDCPGIDECGQASSMHEQLSELTAAQARQESQLRVVVLDRARAEQLAGPICGASASLCIEPETGRRSW